MFSVLIYLAPVVVIAWIIHFCLNNKPSSWYNRGGVSLITRVGKYSKGVDIQSLAQKLEEFHPYNDIRLHCTVLSDFELIVTIKHMSNPQKHQQFMACNILLDSINGTVELTGRFKWQNLWAFIIAAIASYATTYNDDSAPFMMVGMMILVIGIFIHLYFRQSKTIERICLFLDNELEVISPDTIE